VCQYVFADKPANVSEASSQTDQKPPKLIAAKWLKRHIKEREGHGQLILIMAFFYVPFVPFCGNQFRRAGSPAAC
jgi:hypothetical protein